MSHVEKHDVYNVQQGDAGQVQQVERQVLPIEYNVQVQVDEEQVLPVLSTSPSACRRPDMELATSGR